jgi:hypothetical protein
MTIHLGRTDVPILTAPSIARGDISPEKLSGCQRDAAAGKYAQAMAGYLRWLAGRYDSFRGSLRKDLETLRAEYALKDGHRRTPGILADITLGWRYFLEFAREVGALTAEECEALRARVRKGLLEMGQGQAEHHQAEEPAAHFLRLLRSAIASGRAHIAAADGSEPRSDPVPWGWRDKQIHRGDSVHMEWQPQGKRVGWVDGENLYLDPEAAFAAAQGLAGEQGESLPVSSHTLGKRLREGGHLLSTDDKRRKIRVRCTVEKRRHEVWHLSAKAFIDAQESAQSAQ